MEKVVTVKAIKKLISESSQEFKAKLGPNVESKDKEINDKAYSDAKKRAKDFDGGIDKELGEEKIESDFHVDDYNKSLMDYTPANADDNYRKRVKKEFVNGDKISELNYIDGDSDNGLATFENDYIEITVDVNDNKPKIKVNSIQFESDEVLKNVKVTVELYSEDSDAPAPLVTAFSPYLSNEFSFNNYLSERGYDSVGGARVRIQFDTDKHSIPKTGSYDEYAYDCTVSIGTVNR